jgi:hypothetical protein
MERSGKHVGLSCIVFAAASIMGGCGDNQESLVQSPDVRDDPAAVNLATSNLIEPASARVEPTYSQPLPTQTIEAPVPPPPLPQYSQPEGPGENYIWTPGTWNYGPTGYYWVPGAWMKAPFVGALWTPPYWEYEHSHYRLHCGYWARHIGFYGGINYGFGYVGRGFYGGYWNHGTFIYNRAVTNVNLTNVHNVYSHTVVNSTRANRVSYNGGSGGIYIQPIPAELAVSSERHEKK